MVPDGVELGVCVSVGTLDGVDDGVVDGEVPLELEEEGVVEDERVDVVDTDEVALVVEVADEEAVSLGVGVSEGVDVGVLV